MLPRHRMTVLYNHELRLERALQHLQGLETEVTRWLGTNPYSLFHEFDTQGDDNVIRVWSYGTMPLEFGLIISDCVHNLRAALDNLFYDLALAYNRGNPLVPDAEQRVMFPIFGDGKEFKRKGAYRIRDIDPGAQAVIKGLQPYTRGNKYASEPLWALNELSRIDKHRLVYTTLLSRGGGVFGSGGEGRVYDIRLLGGGLGGGPSGIEHTAEIVRYRAEPLQPGGKVHVQFAFGFDIAFGQGSPKYGERVPPTLAALINYIIDKVIPPLAPYLTKIRILSVSQTYSLQRLAVILRHLPS